MNWAQQNKFLGSFFAAFALLSLFAFYFLLHEKGAADDAATRLETTTTELNRLRRGKPFPNEANFAKTKAQTENYRSSLGKLEQDLKARTLTLTPLQPNEFQAQLRQAVNGVVEKARANKVKLPEGFYLGFEQYATSLPNDVAASLLGRELQAVTRLATALVEARVDALTSLNRTPLPEEKATPAPTPTPSRGRRGRAASRTVEAPAPVEAHALTIAFAASPTATRKFLNEIAIEKEQLFIVRTLVVKNQVDKGPKHGGTSPPIALSASSGGAGPAVSFIVGNEHLNVAARIDLINFNPAVQEVR